MPTAKQLRSMGYRVVSRKHRIVARIDRPDWRETVININDERQAADQYRRVHSKDTLIVSHGALKQIGSSGGSSKGYVELDV